MPYAPGQEPARKPWLAQSVPLPRWLVIVVFSAAILSTFLLAFRFMPACQ